MVVASNLTVARKATLTLAGIASALLPAERAATLSGLAGLLDISPVLLAWYRTKRGRLALSRLAASPSMSVDEYQLRYGDDPEKLKRELLKDLRAVDEAIDDELVPPLVRILELRKSGQASRDELRDIRALLDDMSGPELTTLLRILRRVQECGSGIDDGTVQVRDSEESPGELVVAIRDRELPLVRVPRASVVARRLRGILRTRDRDQGKEDGYVIVKGPNRDVNLYVDITEGKRLLFLLEGEGSNL